MKKSSHIIRVLGLMWVATASFAQTADSQAAFGQVVDKAVFQENNLLKILRGEHPIAETYVQDMVPDPELGQVPNADHYFLGKLDFSSGVTTDSFTQKSASKIRTVGAFAHLFSATYFPRGFAQTLLIDGGEFDREHYDFEYVKREFLGDVRTIVIDVNPKPSAGSGRFVGRIWVEDKDFNVVRFNGTYSQPRKGQFYMHFDSWRVNCGPNLWVPFETYAEESDLSKSFVTKKLHFKAITRVWGFTSADDRNQSEFTNLTVDLPNVKDSSEQNADNSPVESLRAWQREGEDNVLDRLEKSNLLAPPAEVEKILDTVINNLVVTNDLNIIPEVRTRVILTTPLESFTVGHTIVISRGLIDTLPDEASLAAILAYELAHIALGHGIDTKFAFSDRTMFDDEAILAKFRMARPQNEIDAANAKALEMLQKSPYKDKLSQAGLFLKALGGSSERLPNLIKALFGSKIANQNNILQLSALIERAPELQKGSTTQIAALPLGARTALDPWTDRLRLAKMRQVPLLSAREKMPFELTPIYLHLTYEAPADAQASGDDPVKVLHKEGQLAAH